MPLYKKNIKMEITPNDMNIMLGRLYSDEHKMALILLYITGARPAEILMLNKGDFIVSDTEVRIQIKTLKRGLDRTLVFDKLSTPFIHILIGCLGKKEEGRIFSFSSGARLRQIIDKASEKKFAPYTFRHSRHYKLAEEGATVYDLMAWKGAKKLDSVMPYVIKSGQMIEKLKDKIK